MEQIGKILKGQEERDLSQAKVSEEMPAEVKIQYTTQEVLDARLTYPSEPPKPETCKFCETTLYYYGLVMLGQVVTWTAEPQRCECEKAKRYWLQYDEKAARRKKAEEETAARERIQRRIDSLLGKSGIKKRYLQRTFEDFQVTPENRAAYRTAKDYAENFHKYSEKGEGLYFEGTYGTGKTHLAVAIALHLIHQRIPCICRTFIDILGDIKNTFDSRREGAEQQMLDLYKDIPLLVIDDLGKELCTEWSMSTLYTILNDRYENMRPTIITTNYNNAELIARLTPKGFDEKTMKALMSRIKGCSRFVTMSWEDWRQN